MIGRVGGPQTCLVPRTQLGNYQIIPNTSEIGLKTDRTNCTTKGQEEATVKRPWVHQMGGSCGCGEECERGAHKQTHKENICPMSLVWKMREAEFREFLQPEGLIAQSFIRQQTCLGQSPSNTALLLKKRQAKNVGRREWKQ